MTAIAAYTTTDAVWMGSDSQLQDDGGIITTHINKVSMLKTEGHRAFLMGSSGCARVGYELDKMDGQYPSIEQETTLYGWITRLADFIMAKLTEDEVRWKLIKQEHSDVLDGSILIAVPGCIWEIAPDFMPVKLSDTYGAIGSGEQFAIGAFMMADYITQRHHVSLSGEERVEVAIRAAIKHLDTCGGEVPITLLTA
jgi:hypothetical protein